MPYHRLIWMAMLSLPLAATAPAAPFTATSTHEGDFAPAFALDGEKETRWASVGAGDQWLQIDFGKTVPITEITLLWEHAYALAYTIEASQDAKDWAILKTISQGAGGEEAFRDLNGEGRYCRIHFTQAAQFGLYSLWEIRFNPEAQAALMLIQVKEKARLRAEEEARQEGLKQKLATLDFDQIVFATRPIYDDGHWYANISYYGPDENRVTYKKGGGIYLYSISKEALTPLLEDEEGTLRDPAVDYDGKTILFSWRKGGEKHFHLYTMQHDGSDIRQLTFGDYDDFEPAWLPDGGIVFVSTRARRWVNCWLTQVAIVHRCDPDGSNIKPISANLEHDNTPWPMPDGRILFMRWEYVDRSQVDYHHLWTMNPDGTGQMTYYGNMHRPGLFIDAKPVPGSQEVLFINSPGHGAREHVGHVALVDVLRGPDHKPAMRNLTPSEYRDPYPLSTDLFLAAHNKDIEVIDREGNTLRLYHLRSKDRSREIHEPRPLRPRPRERVIPPRVNYNAETGKLVLADVHVGRNMTGVKKGDITDLLVLEALPKPINYTGGMDPLSYGGTFTLERIWGTVPVEEDGSAYMELPANRALFFVALDQEGKSVKRMQSFLNVMPGETTSCVGCHEPRTTAVDNPLRFALKATQRPASKIIPLKDYPEVFDFPRDIQPILDKHCLKCHDYVKRPDCEFGPRSGGVILSGDHGPMFSHSYAALTVYHQIADGRDQAVSNLPPRTIGAVASPIMHKIEQGHHGVALSEREANMVRYWLESGAAYPGTYAALGGGGIGAYHENIQIETDYDWPESIAAKNAIEKRCNACHAEKLPLPKQLADENNLSFWRPDWSDPRLKQCRHLMFNLTRPQLSMMLLAPLAKDAGGHALCTSEKGQAIFANTNDPDYQSILALCARGKKRMGEIKRFDMPGFIPPAPYLREMRRYHVLGPNHPDNEPVDFYTLDKRYWQSFDQKIALDHPAYQSNEEHRNARESE